MAGMRDMWKEASLGGAIADFRIVFEQAGKNRWRIAIASAVLTVGTFSLMWSQSWKKERKLPEITYINSWPADRTEQETKAFIAENQRRKEERQALEAEAEEEARKFWKGLGRVSGMDVDAIEAEAKAEQAAKAKAQERPPVDR